MKKRIVLAAGFLGVAIMASNAFAQTSPPPDEQRTTRQGVEARAHLGRCGVKLAGHRLGRLVHSDSKVQTKDGFAMIIVDTGKVTAIDHSAKKMTLERADGQSVTVSATDETKVCKDGHSSGFDAIKEGDGVQTLQVSKGDGNVLKAVRAHTPGTESSRPSSLRERKREAAGRGGAAPTDSLEPQSLDI